MLSAGTGALLNDMGPGAVVSLNRLCWESSPQPSGYATRSLPHPRQASATRPVQPKESERTMLHDTVSAYALLALAVAAGAFAAPLPLTVALAAAGALARQGRLDFTVLFLICTIAAIAGDCAGYAAGRYGIRLLLRIPWRHRLSPTKWCGLTAFPHFGVLVFVTRWALTLPGPAVNLLAGTRRYPWPAFLFADLTGEALWVAIALLPGFVFGTNGAFGLPLAIAAGILLSLGYFVFSRRVALVPEPAASS